MWRLAVGTARQVGKALGYGVVGGGVVLLIVGIVFLESRPDLKVWHTARLDEEFTEDSDVGTFEQYLELEDRLFRQLDEMVYDEVPDEDKAELNRYTRGSRADPGRWPKNWNRSFELAVDAPRAGVLLLHGMSDSPYSLRNLGETLHERGAHVIGLRVPGHGTAPSGLVYARWPDMAAAVRIAAQHLRDKIGDKKLYLIGYSNGGALAVHHALAGGRVDGIVLLSGAIGISPAAALAIWQSRIGRWFGFSKLAWNAMTPEYDPFKYGSFAVNAGVMAYQITTEIKELVDGHDMSGFPPVLAFQSSVDATVSVPALIENLMAKLRKGGGELVIFDINRTTTVADLLQEDPKTTLSALLDRADLPFTLSVITNRNAETEEVENRCRLPGTETRTTTPLGLKWPKGVFSLAHISLPFPAHDPIYGDGSGAPSPGVHLGAIALRGERGVLRVTPNDMLRQRWNPFYSYLEERVLEFTGLAAP